MATRKQRLHQESEELTEEQAAEALQALECIRDRSGEGSAALSAKVIRPPTDVPRFAEFDPVVAPGPPASDLLIADRR